MFGQDVATGKSSASDDYSSSGPSGVANITNKVTPGHERYCYLWDMLETCVPEEYVIVMSGSAIVKDYILLGYTAPNGTNIYLLNGTTIGEQLMGNGSGGSNGTSSSNPSSTESPTEQTTTPSGNGARALGMSYGAVLSVVLSLMVVVAL